MADNGWREILDSDFEVKIDDILNADSDRPFVRMFNTVKRTSLYTACDSIKPAPVALKILYGKDKDEECYIFG